MTYEKHVARALKNQLNSGELYGELILGQWFTFTDDNGKGLCQTDILINTPAFVAILECKLTYTDWAWPQLKQLYKPVVERVFEKPAILIQVCKNLHYIPPNLIESIQEVLDKPKFGLLTWHFLGR